MSRLNNPKHLVAYVRGNSNYDDYSGNNTAMTPTGTFLYSDNAQGRSCMVVYSNSYLTFPTTKLSSTQGSFSCRFSTTNYAYKVMYGYYTSVYDRLWVIMNPDGYLSLTVGNNVVLTSPKTYKDGGFYELTVTWDTDADIYNMYIDGDLIISSTSAYSTPTLTATAQFLASGVAGNKFNGRIGEMRLYNIALTDVEAKELSNMILPTKVPVSYPIAQKSPYGSPVGAWGFNDGKQFDDASGTGNDLENTNLFVSAKGGFIGNGSDSHAVITSQTDFPTGSDAHSFYCWIKPNNLTTYMGMLAYGTNTDNDAWFIRVNNDGKLYHGFWTNDIKSVQTLKQSAWNFVAYRYDGGSQTNHSAEHLFIDGVEVAFTDEAGGGTPSITLSAYTALMSLHNSGTFNGITDGECRGMSLLNYALSDAEIKHIYNKGVPANYLLLVNDGVTDNSPYDTYFDNTGVICGKEMVFDSPAYLDICAYVSRFKDLSSGTIFGRFKVDSTTGECLIAFSDKSDPSSDFTVWVYTYFTCWVREDGTVTARCDSDAALITGKDYIFSLACSPTQAPRLFLDGVAQSRLRSGSGFISNVTDIDCSYIGTNEDDGGKSWYFDGTIYELGISPDVWTDEQAEQYYLKNRIYN